MKTLLIIKRYWTLTVLIIAFGFTSSNLKAQKSHPYLFYTSQRIEALKTRMNKDTLLLNGWHAILSHCNQDLAKPKGGNLENLSFAYVMTGEKKYADRAKMLLEDLTSQPYWDLMDDRTPAWHAGLGTSHKGWLAAVSYDALYNYLTNKERKIIAEKIVKLGITPVREEWLGKDKRLQSLNNMGHNWWSAIVFGAGNCCLAVMREIPEAKKWAKEIMDVSDQFFYFNGSILENKPKSFDPNGGFYESINYANYAISEYLQFRLAWTNSLGGIHKPYDALLEKSVDWFIESSYQNSGKMMSLNFGDSNDFANGSKPAGLLLALGLGKPYYLWYLKQAISDQFGEGLALNKPLGLLYLPDLTNAPQKPALPLSAIYPSMGWVMMRNSWKPNATFLGVKCGFTWNHAHADAGSFVLYHNGQNLLIDGGDVSYGNDAYSNYFVTSRAHNVMLFNGVAQDPQDQYHAVKNPGHVYDLLDGDSFKYVLADATGPTSRNFLRNYRNFLWLGNVILIIDDVHSYDIGQFDFLLHFADKAVKKGPDLEITKENAGILFRPLYPETLPLGYPHDFPEKLKYRIDYGLKDRTTDVKIPYYVLSAPEKTDRTKFVNAILLLDSTNQYRKTFTGSSGANADAGRTNLPVIERFQGTDYLGIRITEADKETEVYINLLADGRLMHRNSSIQVNGWQTDAYITAITYNKGADKNDPKKWQACFMANGSYLRKDNMPIISSLSKVFTHISKNGKKLNIQLDGQPIIDMTVMAGNIQSLQVNGKNETIKYDVDKMIQVKRDQISDN